MEDCQIEFDRGEEDIIDSYLNKVIELRKIENITQMYEQILNIKKYINDSYDFG